MIRFFLLLALSGCATAFYNSLGYQVSGISQKPINNTILVISEGQRIRISCAQCYLCCYGRNPIPGSPNRPGVQVPPAPWSYPIPPRGAPYPPYSPPLTPGVPTPPAPVPSPGPSTGPAPLPSAGPSQGPSAGPTPAPTAGPSPGSSSGPAPVLPPGPAQWQPKETAPGYPYHPIAPGQYATAPVQTVPTTQTPSPCTTTTTTLATIGTPCYYTTGPPAASSTVPSIPPAVTSAPTQPTETAPWWTTSTAPPPAQTTTRGTGNGSINECCFIDLRSIQATVTCGVSTGSKGCCSQSCASTQRQIQINFQLLARYFGQIPSKIECKQAVEMGLVQSTEIAGVCNQYSPIPTVFPSTFATPAPEISVPTAGPGAYVVPNTGGSNSFSIVTSFLTIIMATVLCI